MRVNPKCMSLNISEGFYLKMVQDTQNLRQRYRKPSRRGFQIISYMFNLNVKQALAIANQICCTHYMEYMYIMTQNDRKCQNASKCLLGNSTESNDTSSYILLDHSNAFSLSGGIFWSRTSLPQRILSGEGGWIFNYSPFWGPLAFWLDKLAHTHLAMGPTISDHNWVSMVFSYRGDAITIFT